jgi:hypothetical protein
MLCTGYCADWSCPERHQRRTCCRMNNKTCCHFSMLQFSANTAHMAVAQALWLSALSMLMLHEEALRP